jgi:hypothetical protein
MSKKIWMAGVLALVLTLGVATVAFAAPAADPPNPGGPRGGPGRGPNWPPHLVGEITALGDNQFTMEGSQGGRYTFEVGELTSYLGSLTGFADLKVGDEVAIAGQRSGARNGNPVAHVVVLSDELPTGIPTGGEVTATTSSSLTLETRRGDVLKFNVTADTEFLSRANAVDGLADIALGDHVMVLFEQASSGSLNATLIMVGQGPTDGN